MIVDTSALFAIIRLEQDHEYFVERILADPRALVSAGSLIELQVVSIRKNVYDALKSIEDLITGLNITVVAVDHAQVRIAGQAFARYGQGSGAIAALNFGDCFAYALSKATGEPLLFKGKDFTKTDVAVAA